MTLREFPVIGANIRSPTPGASNQDLLGFVHMIPSRARERILDIAATQLSDGTCFHQYQPLTKKGNAEIGGDFYDDHLWLILSTCAYIKESGDLSILQAPCAYALPATWCQSLSGAICVPSRRKPGVSNHPSRTSGLDLSSGTDEFG